MNSVDTLWWFLGMISIVMAGAFIITMFPPDGDDDGN